MKSRALAVFLVASATLSAQTAPLHLLVSNGMKAVVEQMQPACERAIGHPLAIDFGSTTALKQKIATAPAFDLVIVTSDGIGDLAKENKVAGAAVELARA